MSLLDLRDRHIIPSLNKKEIALGELKYHSLDNPSDVQANIEVLQNDIDRLVALRDRIDQIRYSAVGSAQIRNIYQEASDLGLQVTYNERDAIESTAAVAGKLETALVKNKKKSPAGRKVQAPAAAPVSAAAAATEKAIPNGLIYKSNAISLDLHNEILDRFRRETLDPEANGWVHPVMMGRPINRIVKQYGYNYPYAGGGALTLTDPIPEDIMRVVAAIKEVPQLANFNPNQAIINRYMQKEQITAHIDSTEHFGDTVVSVTLGAKGDMVFTRDIQKYDVPAAPRSVYVMQGEARTQWKHAMKPLSGTEPRFSITFREVNIAKVSDKTKPKPLTVRKVPAATSAAPAAPAAPAAAPTRTKVPAKARAQPAPAPEPAPAPAPEPAPAPAPVQPQPQPPASVKIPAKARAPATVRVKKVDESPAESQQGGGIYYTWKTDQYGSIGEQVQGTEGFNAAVAGVGAGAGVSPKVADQVIYYILNSGQKPYSSQISSIAAMTKVGVKDPDPAAVRLHNKLKHML